MSTYIQFTNRVVRLDSLEDGWHCGLDHCGDLLLRIQLKDGEIQDGSVITQYQDGKSGQQVTHHRYDPGLVLLEFKEGDGQIVAKGERFEGHGLSVKFPDGRWVQHGSWSGKGIEGHYDAGNPRGSWYIELLEEDLRGEMTIKTYQYNIKGGAGLTITEPDDDFRRNNERARRQQWEFEHANK